MFKAMYAIVRNILKGKVASYGTVARLVGYPRCSRQVGFPHITAKNPPFPQKNNVTPLTTPFYFSIFIFQMTHSHKKTCLAEPHTQAQSGKFGSILSEPRCPQLNDLPDCKYICERSGEPLRSPCCNAHPHTATHATI
ncbi:MAG: MGMT family protein [Fibromonadaceae bacterium]|nr:MGMT family protein [Fibromonadaceae bacterium]